MYSNAALKNSALSICVSYLLFSAFPPNAVSGPLASETGLGAKDRSRPSTKTFHVGKVWLRTCTRYTFPVSNPSGSTLKISKVTSSSSSIIIRSYPREIPPGGERYIEVHVTPEATGERSYPVLVILDTPRKRILRFNLNLYVMGRSDYLRRTGITPEVSHETATKRPRRRIRKYYLSAGDVLKRIRGERPPILVDTRSVESFSRLRIPGSIRIPLYAVRTKAYLRARPIVIFNEGYTYADMERECSALRKAGFAVWILAGGLRAWVSTGGKIIGDPFLRRKLNRLPPAAYFRERRFDDWRVIDISPLERAETKKFFPRAIHVPFEKESARFRSAFRRALGDDFAPDGPKRVLVVSLDSSLYDRLDKELGKKATEGLLFLEGGIEGYKRYIVEQKTISRGGKKISVVGQGRSGCPCSKQ